MATDAAWRRKIDLPSLPEVHASIPVARTGHPLRRLVAFLGPGYLVAVGYMDPGNWATDLAGGSAFGYTLLSVVLLSNLMAILLQSLSARLGIATGRDLAQACRAHYPPLVNFALWVTLRGRDHRLRPRRGDRHRDRPEPPLRPAARRGRLAHRARCAPDPASAAAGFRNLEAFVIGLIVVIASASRSSSSWRGPISPRSRKASCRHPRSSLTRPCSTSRSASSAPP